MRVYATDVEYAAWLGVDPPVAGSAQALRTASLRVDEMLIGAVYPVDEDGLPTEANHITALADATCAQAAHAKGSGTSDTGDDPQYAEVQIGSVRLKRATAAEVPGAGAKYSDEAVSILQLAGLIPAEPWVC